MEPRIASIKRKTKETDISLTLNIDGSGKAAVSSGIGFLDHMLDLFAKHGSFDLELSCKGDLHIDEHHSVEDIAICLGEAFAKAIGDKKGMNRYGTFFVPMDEALARCVADFSGRPYFVYEGEQHNELTIDFFKSLSDSAKMNLHLKLEYGRNGHHCLEALFKATARAFKEAVKVNPSDMTIPSTKGVL
ncbi:MAG: imidazoleglycerol-phosphate dehydratase HisB [Fibrobacteres bacterium]|nr:imidazoleglycerol-phosphate dehydratase HisB [Fibrobacterota bacterium]